MAATQKRRHAADAALTAVFSMISLAYVFPLAMVLMNSFKRKAYISRAPFALPSSSMFVGLDNYRNGIRLTDFWASMLWSLVITVLSVALILLCTSMCAWYISRVRTRVTHGIYLLCVFSMVVPFQMVMFTLSKVANVLGLNTPWSIPVIYLGFGAGLAVFLFTGYMKACPIAIEESATIDGCSPLRTFFSIVLPILQPSLISTGILQAMWIWNDYLLPYLVIGVSTPYKTVPVAVQYLMGSYGAKDYGSLMALLVLSIVPIIIFYLTCQKYIIEGVVAGAVKG